MSQLLNEILLTLAYTDQFDYPLTSREVYQRLIGNKQTSLSKVQKALSELINFNLVSKQNSQYCLKGSEKSFTEREKREKISQKKYQQVRKTVKILKQIPWIDAIFVTGSLAMNNSTTRGDIDFMIVTQLNRLWLTRPLVILVSMLLGKKRSRLTEIPNSWCFNLWMTTNSLALQPNQRSVFTAYEICQAKCVFDKNQAALKLVRDNQWIAELLPNFFHFKSKSLRQNKTAGHWLEILFSFPLNFLDWLFYQLQTTYMKPHQTREQVNQQLAFFHPRDTKKIIYKNWRKSLL